MYRKSSTFYTGDIDGYWITCRRITLATGGRKPITGSPSIVTNTVLVVGELTKPNDTDG